MPRACRLFTRSLPALFVPALLVPALLTGCGRAVNDLADRDADSEYEDSAYFADGKELADPPVADMTADPTEGAAADAREGYAGEAATVDEGGMSVAGTDADAGMRVTPDRAPPTLPPTAEPMTAAEPEPKTGTVAAPAEAAPAAEPVTAEEPKPEPKPAPKPKPQPKSEPKPKPEPKSEPKPEPEPVVAPQPETTTEEPAEPEMTEEPNASDAPADDSDDSAAPFIPKPDEKPADEKPADDAAAMKAPAGGGVAAARDTKEKDAEPKPAGADGPVTADDWPMWGGDPTRNMVNKTTGISLDFEPPSRSGEGRKVAWTARLGSQTYGNPVIAGGKVFVGTNNGGEYRPQHIGDRGVLLCFDEEDGEFLWQFTREKLAQGRVHDWPEQGICSTPVVEDGRAYVVSNRCEVVCLDVEGFRDGENDGPVTDEADSEQEDADVIWSLDMIEELGVFPHNLATSSPVIWGDKIFLVTSNGVDEAHLEVPAPRAPCFLCLDKNTGEVIWEDNTPFDNILHGQWSSPAIGVVNGQAQVYMPGGDGWLYAFDPEGDGDGGGKILWKFDLNPKDSRWELGGRGTRNSVIATPVFHENSVVLGVGQDPEHLEGVGHIYRIDATKSGDVSPTIPDGDGYKENPNSAQIWHWGGEDETGEVTGTKGDLIFRRTMSTVGIRDGLVIAPDLSGFVHCLDFETGQRYWEYDMFAACWGSPMIADGKVFIGDEDGELTVLKLGKEEDVLAEKVFTSSVYSTPTIAGGRMYVSDRSRLYAIELR